MAKRKRPARRPNRGGKLRPQADTPRHHFLLADVTKAENEEIQQYCSDRNISVSQFLADLALNDADQPKTKRKRKVIVKPKLQFTQEQQIRLELLARLNEESVDELIRDLIEQKIKAQRVHAPLETVSLRFYLSQDEHEKVLKHIATTGFSARNYLAMLALRAIRTSKKGRKWPRKQALRSSSARR
jgi:hypothetical protein